MLLIISAVFSVYYPELLYVKPASGEGCWKVLTDLVPVGFNYMMPV